MEEEQKKYVVHGMRAKCSHGSMENYLNTDVGHGVVYLGQPLLNANDHEPSVNLTHFGDCSAVELYEEAKAEIDEKYKADGDDGFFEKAGKWIVKNTIKTVISAQEFFGCRKCELDTPLPWMFVNEEHKLDGAPALTIESQCPCRCGGVITIVPVVEEEQSEEASQEAVDQDENNEMVLEMMKETYGFDGEQSLLILKAYDLIISSEKNSKLSKSEKLHDFFTTMAGLCINYSGAATRWKLVCDTPATVDAMEYLKKLGLNEQEVFDLMGAINFQHSEGLLLSKVSDYNTQGFCSNVNCNRECGYQYHITDSKYWNFDYGEAAGKKDFAHELIQYACFSNQDSWFHNLWDFMCLGNLEALTSYKGDVYSTRMEYDDMNSDMDAINLYQLFLEEERSNIFELMGSYYYGINNGEINRAEEFLKNMGNGDAEKGFEALKAELDYVDEGTNYLKNGMWGIIEDALFMDAAINGVGAMYTPEEIESIKALTNKGKIKEDSDVNSKKQEFLEYVYDMWKNDEEK